MIFARLRSVGEFASRYLFVFSLCLVSLLYGLIAGHNELFPYQQLQEAKAAATALIEILGEESDSLANDSPFTSPSKLGY